MSLGTLYIVSAPSGAGKTSLLKAVRSKLVGIKVAVSHTTRDPRPGEVDGEHYHFVSKQEFDKIQNNGEFIEFAEVFGNFYGTSQQSINDLLAAGDSVVLEIDWQGAQQVRKIYPQAVSIFILPPSIKELEHRLHARGQDSEEIIQGRMDQAQCEISHYGEYQYLIINDDMDEAIRMLSNVFTQPESFTPPSQDELNQLLSGMN
jgi:guanylate kinase